ncbi:LCP family protein [Streptoverticillium reticulum]|uniref:LCP family protein n=1 Tax=Streptoverticillium reticulum TaxID=1433415 RepID=UPI0039BF14AC
MPTQASGPAQAESPAKAGIPTQASAPAQADGAAQADAAAQADSATQDQGPAQADSPAEAGDGSGGDGGSGDRPAGAGGGAAKRKRTLRIVRWTALGVSVAVLAAAGVGYFYYEHLNDNIRKGALNLGDKQLDRPVANAEGQRPVNILLLGSDSRATKENQDLGGARDDADRPPLADVQMLVHVSADRSNMSVISVPRDTRVTIPKCTDPDSGKVYKETTSQIINTSLVNGGPGCTVASWEELTGIPIDHFMMIDFSGVVNMADAVGGVPVCVDANVYDDKSGLRLPKGTHTVKGQQALQWLRTRHGFEDGSDIGRTHAQHLYMNSMVRQLKAGTKLSDPAQLTGLAEAATKALTVDKDLGSVKKLYDLADDIKRVPSGRITMTTMPWVADPQDPDAHVIPKPGDADRLFSLVRNDIALDGKDKKKDEGGATGTAPASAKANIPVTVFNGTGTVVLPPATGRGADIAALLVKQGFAKAVSDSTPRAQADTTITYPRAALRSDALTVAKSLGLPETAVRLSPEVQQITLVVGGDWREGAVYPNGDGGDTGAPAPDTSASASASPDAKNGARKPGDNKAPESADPLNGDDKSACMKVNSLNRW